MIFLASDHAGLNLKKKIGFLFREMNIEYNDMGPYQFDENDDYPDYILPAARKISEHPDHHLGIFIGGSGQGEAIAANKVKGIRADVYYGGPKDLIYLQRTHNNANVLSLGARFLSEMQAAEAVKLWLGTDFSKEERHIRRINKINSFEKANH